MTVGSDGELAQQAPEALVDTALERLAELEKLPTAEHVDVFEDLHGRLQRVLDGLDGS